MFCYHFFLLISKCISGLYELSSYNFIVHFMVMDSWPVVSRISRVYPEFYAQQHIFQLGVFMLILTFIFFYTIIIYSSVNEHIYTIWIGTDFLSWFQELDFLNEAKNSEKCVQNFRRLSPHIAGSIYVPKVYWTLSSSRILTMEFMDAKEVTDVKGIKELGIRPVDVSNLVSTTVQFLEKK